MGRSEDAKCLWVGTQGTIEFKMFVNSTCVESTRLDLDCLIGFGFGFGLIGLHCIALIEFDMHHVASSFLP
jgi:hypothetical protein